MVINIKDIMIIIIALFITGCNNVIKSDGITFRWTGQRGYSMGQLIITDTKALKDFNPVIDDYYKTLHMRQQLLDKFIEEVSDIYIIDNKTIDAHVLITSYIGNDTTYYRSNNIEPLFKLLEEENIPASVKN